RQERLEAAKLIARDGEGKYTPHPLPVVSKVLVASDYQRYEESGVVKHPQWEERRIDFQPYPFPSYTEQLVLSLRETLVEGDATFLSQLDPSFVARDLVDDRFVRNSLQQVG